MLLYLFLHVGHAIAGLRTHGHPEPRLGWWFLSLLTSMSVDINRYGSLIPLHPPRHALRVILIGIQGSGKSTFANSCVNLARPAPFSKEHRSRFVQVIQTAFTAASHQYGAVTSRIQEVPIQPSHSNATDSFQQDIPFVIIDTPGFNQELASRNPSPETRKIIRRMLSGERPSNWEMVNVTERNRQIAEETHDALPADLVIFLASNAEFESISAYLNVAAEAIQLGK